MSCRRNTQKVIHAPNQLRRIRLGWNALVPVIRDGSSFCATCETRRAPSNRHQAAPSSSTRRIATTRGSNRDRSVLSRYRQRGGHAADTRDPSTPVQPSPEYTPSQRVASSGSRERHKSTFVYKSRRHQTLGSNPCGEPADGSSRQK